MMEPRMKDELEMTQVEFVELTGAVGSIEAGEAQQERLNEVTNRVGSGEFHAKASVRSLCKCIDGRTCERATEGANTAGGSLTLVVADDLTTKRFSGETFTETIDNTLEVALGQGQVVGGHTSDHASGEASGCGANDKLPEIYATIASSGDAIRTIAQGILGQTVDDATHDMITKNAGTRTDFGSGKKNLDNLTEANADGVEVLEGDHNEVLAVINMRDGTTLDRKALAEEFGDAYQAFNVDAWAFGEAAEQMSVDATEAAQKRVAMVYYNLATAFVLCGPTMRVTVLN